MWYVLLCYVIVCRTTLYNVSFYSVLLNTIVKLCVRYCFRGYDMVLKGQKLNSLRYISGTVLTV